MSLYSKTCLTAFDGLMNLAMKRTDNLMKKTKEPIRGGGTVDSRSITKVTGPAIPTDSLRDGEVNKKSRLPVIRKTKVTDANLRDGGAKQQRRSRNKVTK
jgi:hypothetical protein